MLIFGTSNLLFSCCYTSLRFCIFYVFIFVVRYFTYGSTLCLQLALSVLRCVCSWRCLFYAVSTAGAVCSTLCLQLALSVLRCVCSWRCLFYAVSAAGAVCSTLCLQLALSVLRCVCSWRCLFYAVSAAGAVCSTLCLQLALSVLRCVCSWRCLFYAVSAAGAVCSVGILVIFFLWRCDPTRVMASSFMRLLDHTQLRITVGRTPLDEWPARRRVLYLTIHNTHNRQIFMPPVGFKPTISAGERPQTYALDRAATGTGSTLIIINKNNDYHHNNRHLFHFIFARALLLLEVRLG